MRALLVATIGFLTMIGSLNTANAKDYPWKAEMPAYTARISEPIERIPNPSPGLYRMMMAGDKRGLAEAVARCGGRLSREEKFSENIDMGFRLFADLRDTQGQYHWVVVKFEPSDPNARYDGELSSLGFLLKDGRQIFPERVVTTPYSEETASAGRAPSAPVYDLMADTPLYSDMSSLIGGEQQWYAYLAFPRSFTAKDIDKPLLILGSAARSRGVSAEDVGRK